MEADTQLTELEALLAKATPGPWYADDCFIRKTIPALIKELREADRLAGAAKAIMPPLVHPEVSCWKDVHAALEAWKARKE